jgi:hypothetical protein
VFETAVDYSISKDDPPCSQAPFEAAGLSVGLRLIEVHDLEERLDALEQTLRLRSLGAS